MNPLYLHIDQTSGYIEEKDVNKYLVFHPTDENYELLKKYNDVFNGIRDKIKEISSGECHYEKDYVKTKFNSDDNLPLNKPLKYSFKCPQIIKLFFSLKITRIVKVAECSFAFLPLACKY